MMAVGEGDGKEGGLREKLLMLGNKLKHPSIEILSRN
jgi:hypothetical protein